MRLRFAGLCALMLSALLLGVPSSSRAERIAIATPSRGLFEFPVVVAMRKGFLKAEGLDVDKVQMQPAIAVKALVSGDVDYLLAWGSALRAAVTGVPIKAVVGIASRPLHVLVARPEIKSPKDLKGKIIGVDSVAGTVDYLSRVAVRHFGLEPEKDVKIIVTGESPTRLAALHAGSIDATPIDIAFAVKAEDEGFHRLVYLGDLIELPLSGIAVMDQKLKSQRDQVKRVVRATVRGTRYMKLNRSEAVQMLVRLSAHHAGPGRQSLRRLHQFLHRRRHDLRQGRAARRPAHQRAAEINQRYSLEPVGGLELGEGDQREMNKSIVQKTVANMSDQESAAIGSNEFRM